MQYKMLASLLFVGLTYFGGGSNTTTYVATPTEPIIQQSIYPELNTEAAETLTVDWTNLRPELVKVCQCESGGRQFRSDGGVLVSDTKDHGLCQINIIHLKEAERLKIDIDTLEGNIKFANLLFEREGLSPWKASIRCWQK